MAGKIRKNGETNTFQIFVILKKLQIRKNWNIFSKKVDFFIIIFLKNEI